MKALGTLAFGALVILAANFASAAPAKADSFGVYVGNGGFGIHVNDYDRRHYRHGRRCWDSYYERWVRCAYYRGYHPGYYDGYYRGGYRFGHRGHRNHHWYGHRGRHDGWRGGHRGRHDGWRGRGGRHDGWRGGRGGRHDGRRGHRGRH